MSGNVPNKFFSSLSTGQSLETLISAPLVAVSKANVAMLSGQAQFILDYCFRYDGESYAPVLIKLEYIKGGEKSYINVPLLTILPLNNLAVDNAKVEFNVGVVSTFIHDLRARADENAAEAKVLEKKATIGAKISKSDDKSNGDSAGISVSIKAKQIPLTKGITTLIDVYSKNIVTQGEKDK